MYVKITCPSCGKTKVQRLGIYVDCYNDKLKFDKIEVIEEIEEDEFLKSLHPVLATCIQKGKTVQEIHTILRDICGLSEMYANDILNRLKNDSRVSFDGSRLRIAAN